MSAYCLQWRWKCKSGQRHTLFAERATPLAKPGASRRAVLSSRRLRSEAHPCALTDTTGGAIAQTQALSVSRWVEISLHSKLTLGVALESRNLPFAIQSAPPFDPVQFPS